MEKMIQPRPVSVVRVSRPHTHQFVTGKKQRRPNNIIHTTIGSPKRIGSTNNNLRSKTSLPSGYSTQTNPLSIYSEVTLHKSKTEVSDQKGTTNDHHQESKPKKMIECSRRCFITSLVASLLLLLIIAAILLALFIKPQTQTTKTLPSNIPVLRWNTTGITVAGITSSPGNASNQLNTPYDVILDYANNLYIVDQANHRIQKYMFGASTGQTWVGGTPGASQSQLYYPSRVIMNSNEDLYISDTGNIRVQFWPYGASSGTTVAGTTGSSGNASNQFINPFGIALNPTSNVLYISDRDNHRIMSYASGVNNGTLVLGGIGPGTSNTQLYWPIGVHIDLITNSLAIVNAGCNNIVRYVLGTSSNWILIAGNINGSSGATSTSFNYPTEVTLDPMGNIYVADGVNERIQFFYANQLNGTTIVGFTGTSGNNATTLNGPLSVRLDSQLNLYVADSHNHRIQKFLRY